MALLARHASHAAAAALRRALSWPARISAERRAMRQLARMSDCEMRDIGLVRQDIVDAGALRPDADPSARASRRRDVRGRSASGRTDMAA
jgi:uncharacterized protein YjiS (DUF1127 family)